MSKTFRIGDIVTAKVTGVQNYGVFLELDEDTQGLIHISECKHGYMDNVHDFVKVGQEVTAKVIDVDEFSNKISLSIRALEKLDVPDFPQRIKKNRKRYEHLKKLMYQMYRNESRKIANAMFHQSDFQA